MTSTSSTAFIWDFDGTLADTRLRNYHVTCRLFTEATGRGLETFPALETFERFERTQRRYVNWRQLLSEEFGFSVHETARLGGLWAGYQLADTTPVPLFDGLGDVIRGLGGVRHGVVSQNARAQIVRTLEAVGLASRFGAVIGYDSVAFAGQKPAPDGFLACLDALRSPPPARVVSIGDHQTDVRCARNARQALRARGTACEVIAIAVRFVDGEDPTGWDVPPDYVAESPADLLRITREWVAPA